MIFSFVISYKVITFAADKSSIYNNMLQSTQFYASYYYFYFSNEVKRVGCTIKLEK